MHLASSGLGYSPFWICCCYCWFIVYCCPRGSVFGTWFVIQYKVSCLDVQSSWWGREIWLLYFNCVPDILWLYVLRGFSSRCRVLVCSVWLWYFLIIRTYIFESLLIATPRLRGLYNVGLRGCKLCALRDQVAIRVRKRACFVSYKCQYVTLYNSVFCRSLQNIYHLMSSSECYNIEIKYLYFF